MVGGNPRAHLAQDQAQGTMWANRQSAWCLKVESKVVNRADVFFNPNDFQRIRISERMGHCQKEINEIQR